MIVEYVRYRIATEDAERFLDAYRAAAQALDQSPHCLGYELSRCHEEPERFVLRIRWRSIAEHLEGFRRSQAFGPFLSAVRPFIDRIEEMQHYTPTDVGSKPSIYEAMGGVSACFRLARVMHHEMQQDATLGGLFANARPTHVPHLGMWLTQVFGGPKLYSEALDDIAPMLARHAGLDISETQRLAFNRSAQRAVDLALAEAPPQAREAVLAYIEWGTRVAVENSKPDHHPDPGAGVPSWDWGPSR